MDALDLLFRRLVLAAREADALTRPLDVGEIIERFAPYRMARRDGAFDTNDDYLHVVMRLLSGERGLVFADELLQDDLKAELASSNADLTLLRTYMNTKVRLATDRVQAVLGGDTSIDLTPEPVEAKEPTIAPAPKRESTPKPKPTGGCPYCNAQLPEGRPLKFCPSCGQNLLVRRCSGCSAEIESGWKFCVTCGRSAA